MQTDDFGPSGPAVYDQPASSGSRWKRGRIWMMGAVAVLLVAGLVLAAVRPWQDTDVTGPGQGEALGPGVESAGQALNGTPLDCPKTFGEQKAGEVWVPTKPSSAAAAEKLAPESVSSMVICSYSGPVREKAYPVPFRGRLLPAATAAEGLRQRLAAGTSGVRDRACTLIGSTRIDTYLVGMTTADGPWWVSVTMDPNSCTPAGNGIFTTGDYLADVVASVYAGGPPSHEPSDIQRCLPVQPLPEPAGTGGSVSDDRGKSGDTSPGSKGEAGGGTAGSFGASEVPPATAAPAPPAVTTNLPRLSPRICEPLATPGMDH